MTYKSTDGESTSLYISLCTCVCVYQYVCAQYESHSYTYVDYIATNAFQGNPMTFFSISCSLIRAVFTPALLGDPVCIDINHDSNHSYAGSYIVFVSILLGCVHKCIYVYVHLHSNIM